MRVLVTGSHGFIGSQLVKALKARGDEVLEYDIKIDKPWTHVKADVRVDEIYHLACMNQEMAAYHYKAHENVETNALAARYLALVAQRSGARFVYTSTASVYGNTTFQPIPSSWFGEPKSDYAVAKLAGEHFVRNSGADYTVFRLSNVYGPGQLVTNPYCGVVAKFFEDALHGRRLKIIGDGSQTRDFTYVEDILPHLMNPDLKGVLNCSHGRETSVKDLATHVSFMFGPELRFDFAPERPVDGIQRRCLVSDVECPTDLETGLRKTLQWLQDEEIPVSAGVGRS